MDQFSQSNIQLLEQAYALGWSGRDLGRIEAGYGLVMRHLSGRYRPDGRVFLEHLVRTASILLSLGESRDVVLAGLVHAALSHGDYAHPSGRAPASALRELVDAVGEEAARIVQAYTAFRWNAGAIEAAVEALSERPGSVSSIDRAVLTIRVANEAEEGLDRALLYVSEVMYDDTLEKLRLSATLAHRLGKGSLAALVAAVLADYEGTASRPMNSAAVRGCFWVYPPSTAPRLALRVQRRARRVGRDLMRRWLPASSNSR
jgi:(p)ppGpp synthase/HD superfamily hydrolase